MTSPRFLDTQVGYVWILADLATKGPHRNRFWSERQLRKLREAGLVCPALRIHRAWEITEKGRAVLGIREARTWGEKS